MTESTLQLCWEAKCDLGESPVWLEDREAPYFVDINKKILCEHGESGRHQVFVLSSETGSIAPLKSLQDCLILAQENFLTLFSLDPPNGIKIQILESSSVDFVTKLALDALVSEGALPKSEVWRER